MDEAVCISFFIFVMFLIVPEVLNEHSKKAQKTIEEFEAGASKLLYGLDLFMVSMLFIALLVSMVSMGEAATHSTKGDSNNCSYMYFISIPLHLPVFVCIVLIVCKMVRQEIKLTKHELKRKEGIWAQKNGKSEEQMGQLTKEEQVEMREAILAEEKEAEASGKENPYAKKEEEDDKAEAKKEKAEAKEKAKKEKAEAKEKAKKGKEEAAAKKTAEKEEAAAKKTAEKEEAAAKKTAEKEEAKDEADEKKADEADADSKKTEKEEKEEKDEEKVGEEKEDEEAKEEPVLEPEREEQKSAEGGVAVDVKDAEDTKEDEEDEDEEEEEEDDDDDDEDKKEDKKEVKKKDKKEDNEEDKEGDKAAAKKEKAEAKEKAKKEKAEAAAKKKAEKEKVTAKKKTEKEEAKAKKKAEKATVVDNSKNKKEKVVEKVKSFTIGSDTYEGKLFNFVFFLWMFPTALYSGPLFIIFFFGPLLVYSLNWLVFAFIAQTAVYFICESFYKIYREKILKASDKDVDNFEQLDVKFIFEAWWTYISAVTSTVMALLYTGMIWNGSSWMEVSDAMIASCDELWRLGNINLHIKDLFSMGNATNAQGSVALAMMITVIDLLVELAFLPAIAALITKMGEKGERPKKEKKEKKEKKPKEKKEKKAKKEKKKKSSVAPAKADGQGEEAKDEDAAAENAGEEEERAAEMVPPSSSKKKLPPLDSAPKLAKEAPKEEAPANPGVEEAPKAD
jgi:hypothetical protein